MEMENRNLGEGVDVGCETCYRREDCERAAEGSFCGWWASKAPEVKGEDPNEKWRRGDEDWETE